MQSSTTYAEDIRKAIEAVGHEGLGPVKHALPSAVGYHDIKLMYAAMQVGCERLLMDTRPGQSAAAAPGLGNESCGGDLQLEAPRALGADPANKTQLAKRNAHSPFGAPVGSDRVESARLLPDAPLNSKGNDCVQEANMALASLVPTAEERVETSARLATHPGFPCAESQPSWGDHRPQVLPAQSNRVQPAPAATAGMAAGNDSDEDIPLASIARHGKGNPNVQRPSLDVSSGPKIGSQLGSTDGVGHDKPVASHTPEGEEATDSTAHLSSAMLLPVRAKSKPSGFWGDRRWQARAAQSNCAQMGAPAVAAEAADSDSDEDIPLASRAKSGEGKPATGRPSSDAPSDSNIGRPLGSTAAIGHDKPMAYQTPLGEQATDGAARLSAAVLLPVRAKSKPSGFWGDRWRQARPAQSNGAPMGAPTMAAGGACNDSDEDMPLASMALHEERKPGAGHPSPDAPSGPNIDSRLGSSASPALPRPDSEPAIAEGIDLVTPCGAPHTAQGVADSNGADSDEAAGHFKVCV